MSGPATTATGAARSGEPLSATVVPDVTGLDRAFDYLVPTDLADVVRVGSLVRVPLQGRQVVGWVVRVGTHDVIGTDGGQIATERLLPLTAWLGHGPDAQVIDLARWAAHRWAAGRLRALLVSASPPTRVRRLPVRGHRPVSRPAAGRSGSAVALGELLAAGGGVWRTTPSDTGVDAVTAVLGHVDGGTTMVIDPSQRHADGLIDRLRRQGLVTARMPDDWALAAGGAADVVVGARSAVWATVPDLRAIVVLDEHDETLQSVERTPTWHARDVAIERSTRLGVPCVLVSPCPTLTALHWSGRRWLRPDPRSESLGWPEVEVVDRRDDPSWPRSLLSSEAIAAIRDRRGRVVCVYNAKGRARLLACRACRGIQRCDVCATALAQGDDSLLSCGRCGSVRPPVCGSCGSTALGVLRPGVTRLRDEMEAAAGRPVVAVTASTPAAELTAPADVYLGTSAVVHRVPEADTVIVLDLDSELLAPRYRAAEQAMALVVDAARLLRPLGAAPPGRLLLQTTLVDHDVVRAAVTADPGLVARAEADRRRALGLPPFGALARVSGDGATAFVAGCALEAAVDGDGFLVRAPTWAALADGLAATPRPEERVRVEVDPPRR